MAGGSSISSVSGDGSSVKVSGESRKPQVIDGSTFRDAVNTWAPCLRPDRYPSGALPVTIPSLWMTATSSGGAAVVAGRGWGHGVGMVQWGPTRKALRGWSSGDPRVLLRRASAPAVPEPGLIHVEVASGLLSVRMRASGSGATIDGRELGPGTLVITGGDKLTLGGTALSPA